MNKSNGNYIKVTLYKVKVGSDVNLSAFTLKMEFSKQSQESEKILTREMELGGKSYFFELPLRPTNLEISAVSKTFLIFDSFLAKVSIPVNPNKLDDKREWFYLKNSKEENLISVLCSIYCEVKSDKTFYLENNLSCLVSPQNKNDISYDILRNTSCNNQMMNRTLQNPNVPFSNVQNILSNINNYSLDENLKSIKAKNHDNTVIYNENYKSPDLSTITNNHLFSPYSNRVDYERGNLLSNPQSGNYNQTLNVSNLKLNDLNFLSIESYMDDGLENVEDPELVKKLRIKLSQMKDEQEKLRKVGEDLQKTKEKLKQNEKILMKEKEKLEQHIRLFKGQKTDFENKSHILNQNYSKLQTDLNKFIQEKELFNFEKKLVMNLNLMLHSGKNLSNMNFPEEKISEVNHKLSINNLTLPNTTGITNVTNSSGSLKGNLIKRYAHSNNGSQVIKKEVVLENPQAFAVSVERKQTLSKEKSKIQIDKEKLLKNMNSSSSNSDNTFNSNDHSLVNKTFNNNISKFYTPTAHIDLRRGSSNSSLGPSQNIMEFASPKAQKSQVPENKLLDSLDNMALLYPSKHTINVSDKKNTFKRNGSDEVKGTKRRFINKNTFNNNHSNYFSNKDPSSNNGNTIPVNNITLLKDSQKKSMLTTAKNSSEKVISLKKDISPLNINLINAHSSSTKLKMSSAKKMKI